MQNDEPQRPPVGRPSLLSAGPAQEESNSILSELDGTGRKAGPAGAPARRARKGLVAGTVFALAAVGGVVALVVQDVNSITQVPPMAAAQQAAAPLAGLAQDAVPAPIAEPADAPSGGSAAAVIQDTPAVVAAAQVAGSVVDSGGAAAGSAAVLQAPGPVALSGISPATSPAASQATSPAAASLATSPATLPAAAAGAVVAAPALALASALAAPSPDKASSAATIVDTAPAPAEQKAVRKVSQKSVQKSAGKARKAAAAKEKERAVRLAKARGAAVAKEKTPRKTTQPKPAAHDNDVELLAALVAHTRPQQPARAALPCPKGDDKDGAGGTTCGMAQK